MAFEGNIEDFGVSDVLQLINSQGKTGVLDFKKRKETISIGFEDGMISTASHNKKGVLRPIVDYLVLTGKVSKSDLKKYSGISKKKGVLVVDTLVERGILTKEDLEKIIEFKIQEIVDELFTWENGEYKFMLGEKLYSKSNYKVLVNPQFLILEGMRRIDEWPKIEKAIPDAKIVFSRKKKPSLSIKMGEQEKIVLPLLNGERSVEEVVELSGLGRFRTYHTLFILIEGGAIEKGIAIAKSRHEKRISLRIPTEDIASVVMWITAGIFLIVNFAFALSVRPFYRGFIHNKNKESIHIENYKEYMIKELEEVFRIIKGRKPVSSDELKMEGWFKE